MTLYTEHPFDVSVAPGVAVIQLIFYIKVYRPNTVWMTLTLFEPFTVNCSITLKNRFQAYFSWSKGWSGKISSKQLQLRLVSFIQYMSYICMEFVCTVCDCMLMKCYPFTAWYLDFSRICIFCALWYSSGNFLKSIKEIYSKHIHSFIHLLKSLWMQYCRLFNTDWAFLSCAFSVGLWNVSTSFTTENDTN